MQQQKMQTYLSCFVDFQLPVAYVMFRIDYKGKNTKKKFLINFVNINVNQLIFLSDLYKN